jgi:hypothetical protein
MNTQLFDCSTPVVYFKFDSSFLALRTGDQPESVTRSNQHLESILDQPKADFRQVGALADAIHTNEGDTVWKSLLARRKWGGQFGPDRQQEIG